MAKTKVSEWDVVADNNQDISGITLGTGMPPSYVNDSIREMMAQIKDWQSGSSGDSYTITGNLGVNGTLTINGSSGTSGQVLVSQGDGSTPKWGDAFVSGMIMLWSGSTGSVPTGWAICDGANNTPDLRDRFVVGAGNTYDVDSTGGRKDAVVVSHTHNVNLTDHGHSHSYTRTDFTINADNRGNRAGASTTTQTDLAKTGIIITNSYSGESGTDKNLPPYYALAYIMKV